MTDQSSLLIVFVKNPRPGKVKTRLAESVGDSQAFQIYCQLLHHTKHILKNLEMAVQVWFSDSIPENGFWDQPGVQKRKQQGEDLGSRMKYAFQKAFSDGFERVIIIGSDCAELTASIINKAFDELEKHDMVVGPSKDGGYYLLGMTGLHKRLFEDKAWSTPEVFNQTTVDIKAMGLSYVRLPVLNDVDTKEDWDEVKNKFRKEPK